METKDIVEEAIKQQGTLQAVARKLEVSYTTAHAWKTGKSTPRGKNLLRLIALAGKSISAAVISGIVLYPLMIAPQVFDLYIM